MHTYLRAVGFSNIVKVSEEDKLLETIMTSFTERITYKISDNEKFMEVTKYFDKHIGITIRGICDEEGNFHIEHYFPFLRGRIGNVEEQIIVNKKNDNNAYSCMCDDVRLGVSLIFYMQNVIDYFNRAKTKVTSKRIYKIYLSGLSVNGKILLPIERNNKSLENMSREHRKRSKLLAEAKQGSREALDDLTISDMDKFAMISRRTKHEDVYSIVNTSFYPYGTESDNYTVIGTIMECDLIENKITGEKLYYMLIECNELMLNICINQKDLFGEPYVGARYKGIVWLQGKIDFTSNNDNNKNI